MTGFLKILLFPLSLIYGSAVRIRNLLFDLSILRSAEFNFPVIAVGNLTVGGTGKTPHVEYLVRLIKDDHYPAVLSRGYKRKSNGFKVAEVNSLSDEVGDEPLQVKRKFPEIIVAVESKRVKGINEIIKRYPEVKTVILDDAFQHRWVSAGFNILLTDYNNLITRDYLMPYGRLREHRSCRRRADIILVTRSPENMSAMERRLIAKEIDPASFQHLYFTSVVYHEPVNLFYPETSPVSLTKMETLSTNFLLLAGIANPGHFFGYVSGICSRVTTLRYPDHHSYTNTDITRIAEVYNSLPVENRCIITTEKDAARLSGIKEVEELFGNSIYYIPIGIRFLNDDETEFNNYILNYVRKVNPNSIVS